MVVLDETANEILHKSGWQAEVTVYATRTGKQFVKKIFGKKTNITGDFSVYELIRFQRSFQAKAKKIGIPIVPSKRFVKLQTGASHDSYIEIQRYIPQTFREVILGSKKQTDIHAYFHQFFAMYKKVWESGFLISLDPVIDNFGIDHDGTLRFFDYFPPFQTFTDSTYYVWPKPPEVFEKYFIQRYYSSVQAKVIYAQLLRVCVNTPLFSREHLLYFIHEYLGAEAVAHCTFHSKDIEKLLSNPTLQDVDNLRIIAGEMCLQGLCSSEDMNRIYALTHIPGDNSLPKIGDILEAAERFRRVISSSFSARKRLDNIFTSGTIPVEVKA